MPATPTMPFRRNGGYRSLLGAALVVAMATAYALVGGGGSSVAQGTDFCPPTIEHSGSVEPTATAVRGGHVEEVRLFVRFGPTCEPSLTATALRGSAARVVIPFTTATPATARAFRLEAPNLCSVSVAKALRVTGHAHRGHTCEEALLAFYLGPTPSPKEGTAVGAESCEIVGIARKRNQKTATAHRETIPVDIELLKIFGTQGQLFSDELVIKVSDPSVGTPYIAAPANSAQLKECNAP